MILNLEKGKSALLHLENQTKTEKLIMQITRNCGFISKKRTTRDENTENLNHRYSGQRNKKTNCEH